MRLPHGRSHFVMVGDVCLHVREDGAGSGPAFVYLNSLGSDMRIWDGVAAALPGRHLRHDARGHGLSSAPEGPYTIRQLADELRALLALSSATRVVLVGISVGGLVALRAALEWPELVSAMVVCDSAARIGSEESWNQRIDAVEKDGLAAVAPGVVERWFSPGFVDREPAVFAGYRHMLERTTPHGYAATCAALRDEDLRGSLDRIEVPTLVLCGSDDQATPPELSLELAEALPNGRYQEIAGAGHLPCLERPAVMARAIEGFLEEVGDG